MEEKQMKKGSFGQWIKDICKLRKEIFKYNKKNFLNLLLVVAVCFVFIQLATAGFLKCLILFAERVSGKDYIAANNVIEYIKSPIVILIVLIYIIVLCNILVFQIGIFVYLFEESKNNRRASLLKMLDFGFHSLKKLIYPKNWLIYVFVLLVLPLSDAFHFSYFNVSLVVPGFIMDVVESKLYFAIPYNIFMFLLLVLTVLCAFCFHYFLLEDISFFKACKKSVKMFIKKLLTNIVTIINELIIIFVEYLSVSIIVVLVSLLFRTNDINWDIIETNFASILQTLFLITSLPIAFSIFSVLFHHANDEEEMLYDDSKIIPEKKIRIIRNSCLLAFVLAFTSLDVGMNINNYQVYNSESSAPIVIAHRGSSIKAPENSIPAFELAIEEGADMIELDIHQTKDGVLVITHDDSLNRIAKINKHVYDLTYDELSKLDVGSWFSQEFSYLRVATLEDVLKLTKNKIDLLIEIKPTSHDDHLEEELIRLIYKYDMKDQVVVHSLKDAPLIRVKELDSSIKVAYCMLLALGDIEKISWSDLYTVEETNVTPELVRKVHEAGKKIYVWTINRYDTMQYLIDCGVDGFIGDNAKELISYTNGSIYDKGFSKFLRMISLQHPVM